MRLGALVATSPPSRQIHHAGFPPEVTGADKGRTTLPAARFVVITPTGEGLFLYRYAEDGVDAGDTWHRSVEEAKDQANYEYGAALGEWVNVPDDALNAVEWLRSHEG